MPNPVLVPREDIQKYIEKAIPPHLDVFRRFFTEFDDVLLNESRAADALSIILNYYNHFETSGISPMLVYDKRLLEFSGLDIRNLIALSISDAGPSFYTQFFASFFERFELYYSDSEENRYENISGLIYTDEGHFTDDATFTDEGVGQGAYCLLADILTNPYEFLHNQQYIPIAANLMVPMRPGRLHVFVRPVVEVRLNQLIFSDPEYDATLVTGDERFFENVTTSLPARLETDASPEILTDGDPPVTTDNVSTIDFLQSLSNINVKYASDPNTTVQLPLTNKIIDQGDSVLYMAEIVIPENIVWFSLTGAVNPFSATVVRNIFIEGFVKDPVHEVLRLSWSVKKGAALS